MPISEPSHLALFITSLVGGGAERVTLNLAAALADRGHTLDLLVGRKEGQLHEHIPATVRIINLGAVSARTTLRLANWRGCFKSGERGPLRGKIGPHVRQVFRRVDLGPPQTFDGGNFDHG